jgi:hypothetical protein
MQNCPARTGLGYLIPGSLFLPLLYMGVANIASYLGYALFGIELSHM